MKKLSRRQFSKLAGAAALAVPVAAPVAAAIGSPQAQQAPAAAPTPEPKPKLTPEQEEAVKRAIERRDRQLSGMRNRTLAYSLEPAFVFSVRQRPRSTKKAGV